MPEVITRLQAFLERLGSYPWWEIAIELAVIWVVVYAIVRFVQGTRAAGALKGLLLLLIGGTILARVIGGGGAFERLTFLYDRVLGFVAIALLVVFQPELRRALIRLGEARWWGTAAAGGADVASAIAEASGYLAKARFGAIVVIERRIGLKSLTEGGTTLNADLTARLLQSLFYPGSALHDLAVIVQGGRVHAAGVQLPLADPSEMPDPELGSRHRAAVGVTKESDALVVVVSEETGAIRLAERGRLSKPYPAEELRDVLRIKLGRDATPTSEVPGEEADDGLSDGMGERGEERPA